MKSLSKDIKTFFYASAVTGGLLLGASSLAVADQGNLGSVEIQKCANDAQNQGKVVCKQQADFTPTAQITRPMFTQPANMSATSLASSDGDNEVKMYALVLIGLGFVAMLKRRRQRNVGMALA
jgi:hypothetical protein